MKILIMIPIIGTVASLLGLLTLGCSSTGPEIDGKELMNLQFTRSAYSADQALILRATPNPDIDPETLKEHLLTVQLTSSNGASTTENLSPWEHLTDEEMVEAIKDGPGRAALRIKEADQKSARNSQGELVRSEEAMNRFIEWVEAHDKLSKSWISQLQPDIGIKFSNEPTVELVKEIRSHENVEFMEPVQYGEYSGEYLSTASGQAMADDFVTILLPERSFTYSAGETVTAKFQQADGTVLNTSVTITE